MQASEGKLSAALARVEQLEMQLARLLPVEQGPHDPGHQREVAARLLLVAPVLSSAVMAAAGHGVVPDSEGEQPGEEQAVSQLAAQQAEPLLPIVVARRNAAAHCFTRSAKQISGMGRSALNALQRGRRPAGRRRKQAASDTWQMVRNRRSRSRPVATGAGEREKVEEGTDMLSADLAVKSADLAVVQDSSMPMVAEAEPPLSGPRWFKQAVLQEEEPESAEVENEKESRAERAMIVEIDAARAAPRRWIARFLFASHWAVAVVLGMAVWATYMQFPPPQWEALVEAEMKMKLEVRYWDPADCEVRWPTPRCRRVLREAGWWQHYRWPPFEAAE